MNSSNYNALPLYLIDSFPHFLPPADQELHGRIFGLNIPVFGAVAGSVGVVVLCALTASIVVCCCRRKRTLINQPARSGGTKNNKPFGRGTYSMPSSCLTNFFLAPHVTGTAVNAGAADHHESKPVYQPAASSMMADQSSRPMNSSPLLTTGYMTLPLKSAMSGNLLPPAVEQGQIISTTETRRPILRRRPNCTIIPLNISSALYSGLIHKMGHYHWCLAK